MKDGRLGFLLHLSGNFWREKAPELSCEDEEWRVVTARMAERGYNLALIDLGDGVRWESRPEIAVRGAWTRARLGEELDRLRSLGITPVPKLNFSAAHDAWLGVWGRMVSTEPYYRVCADLIREAAEAFGRPELFHIGWDEEDERNQKTHDLVVFRGEELLWHDLDFLVKTAESAGSRAWVWSDVMWERPEAFLRRMPSSVMQSNWYYDAAFDERAFRWPRVDCYRRLSEAGFEQIPTASNCVCPDNAAGTVRFCRKHAAKGLKGFLMTTWKPLVRQCRARNLAAVDQLADAVGDSSGTKN